MYGSIAAPLKGMLKKEGFKWTDQSREAFEKLKISLIKPLVLKLPDFEKEFVVECAASGSGLGAVLMQENHHIAYLSQNLKGNFLALYAY